MADKRSAAANPAWLKWLVMAFLGYAVYLHFTGERLGPVPPAERGKAGLTDARPVAAPLKDITDSSVKIGGDIKGGGDEAICGQTATVRVSAFLPDGKEFTGTAVPEGAKQVHVGKADDAYPWISGLTGMSVGGVREVLVPVRRVLEKDTVEKHGFKPEAAVRFRVQLDALTPTAKRDGIPYLATDTVIGHGRVTLCGDNVSYRLRLWKPDGAVRYDSGNTPITAQLGDASVFYGLDRTLLGMREGGVRTVIVPPAYLVSPGAIGKKHPALAALPEGEIAVADVSLIASSPPKQGAVAAE